MNDTITHHAGPQPFEHLAQVGTVELDRYCVGCGYNLRQQAIRKETTTGLLMCKCPECGTFEPANTLTTATRSWFRFIVVLVWLLWIVVWLNLIFWSVFSVTGLAVVSGDIRRSRVEFEQVDPSQLFENERLEQYRQELAQQQLSQQNNSATAPSHFYYSDVTILRQMDKETFYVLILFAAMAATVGALMTAITTVAMPHWRRWGYVCFAIGWPLIGVLIFHLLIWPELYHWRLVTVDLISWHLKIALSVEAIAVAGGLVAVWLGRPVSRGIVRLIVPPKRRGPFAYLWLADGKTPPKTA